MARVVMPPRYLDQGFALEKSLENTGLLAQHSYMGEHRDNLPSLVRRALANHKTDADNLQLVKPPARIGRS
jgi:hypothetical protein